MFFLLDLLALGAMGAGSFVAWRDYRNGFPKTRALVGKVARALGVGGLQLDEVSRANSAIERFARGIGALREAVAEVETNYRMALTQEAEQRRNAEGFAEVVIEALRKGDEVTASVAAVAKINAEQRAALHAEHAQQSVEVATVLKEELDFKEMEFDAVRTEAETVRVKAAIAEARQRLYQIVSHVDAETGLTARGELKQALINSERKMIKSGILLDMAQKTGDFKIRKMLQAAEIKTELDEARKRISLPAPADGDGDGHVYEAVVVGEDGRTKRGD